MWKGCYCGVKVELVGEMRLPPTGIGGNSLYRIVWVVLVELPHTLVAFPVNQTEPTQITRSDHYGSDRCSGILIDVWLLLVFTVPSRCSPSAWSFLHIVTYFLLLWMVPCGLGYSQVLPFLQWIWIWAESCRVVPENCCCNHRPCCAHFRIFRTFSNSASFEHTWFCLTLEYTEK